MNLDAIRGLSQPDQRSCGPSSLVAAHILLDPAYAATQNPHAFAGTVLALHRQLTGASAFGRAQLPWPRALGTPPWAVARAMTSSPASPTATTSCRCGTRTKDFDAAPRCGHRRAPLPLYVGDWIPRHVVLAVAPTDDGVARLQPRPRHGRRAERADFEAGKLTTFGRWTRPWFVVLPKDRG